MSSGSDKASIRRLGTLLAILLGLGMAVWILAGYGAAAVLGVLLRVGWFGAVLIVAFHLLQMLASAAGWRVIMASSAARPRAYLGLRWIRETVNNLLPLAQIGGDFVTARLLQGYGPRLAPALAGTIADLLLEIATQIVFTVLGLILLVRSVGESSLSSLLAAGLLGASILLGLTFFALRRGLMGALERALLRLARSLGWPQAARLEGLQAALWACYRVPGRVALASAWHLVSWLLGSIEVCLILHFFGRDVGLDAGLVIESLGQATKALGFAIPAALGVQEGGYLLVCTILGLPPEMGIALSLMKRVREVAWGIPGLLVWQATEAKHRATPSASISGDSR